MRSESAALRHSVGILTFLASEFGCVVGEEELEELQVDGIKDLEGG